MQYLPCTEIEPRLVANASVIWLHGLGASGDDFVPIVPLLALPEQHQVRYVFPHAPEISVTINMGYRMPAWYDILEMTVERKIDCVGLLASAKQVQALIQREIDRGIASQRIIIAGFSQGGAVAYQSALTFQRPLGGLLVMSSYFASHASINIHPCNRQLPIHIYHGSADTVVLEKLGLQARQYLLAMGLQPEYSRYYAEHNICPQQINDIATELGHLLSRN